MGDIRLEWGNGRADFALLTGAVGAPEGEHWALFAGTGQISTPASAVVNDATAGNFGVRAKVALTDWTPGATVSIVDQSDDAGVSRFYFNLNAAGYLAIGLSEDGGAPDTDLPSTVPVSAADGETLWVRADVDQVGGEVLFYTSADGASWTPLGAAVTLNNNTGPSAITPLWIGRGRSSGGQLSGRVYRVEVRDGIGAGTIVALFDAEEGKVGAVRVSSSTGEEWALSGVALTAAGGIVAAVAYDLKADEGLETAVMMSLFTDRRASETDELPDLGEDRRGWWGDALPVIAGDETGSKLWLLRRSKLTPDVLGRAEQYAREALAWLVEDGVAASVDVRVSSPRTGWLALEVDIRRPRERPVQYRFSAAWAAQGG